MDHSMLGLPVHHQLLEFTQTHVHWVSDAIQPSHPLSSLSPPAFNLSQHQGLFQGVSSSHQVAKVLEFQLQHQSFQWIFKTDFLLDWLVGFPCSPRDSQESSPTPQFKSINYSVLSFLYSPTLTFIRDYWKKPKFWNFSFSTSPSSEYLGLISFRIDCFDLAAQGTLKRVLQHHSSKASVCQYSAFFMVKLSHSYMTTEETTALTYMDICQQRNISAF